MEELLPVWPVGGVTPDELVAAIDRWVDSPAMAGLVRQFGAEPPTGPLDEKLDALLDVSEIWDGREGRERFEATYADHPAATNALVLAASRTLGLAGRDRPAGRSYDHVLILGGGVVTGRMRARFAADLVAAGVRVGTVCALGSLRELSVNTEALGDPAPPKPTEGDAMLAGAVRAFPPGQAISRVDGTSAHGSPWWVRRYTSGPIAVSVIAAPSTRPGQRANTADTLIGWADLVVRPGPHDRVLLVTTDIYVPFQHIEGIRTLGLTYGCGIDTVGLDTSTYPDWPSPSSVGETLQELRSALFSMSRLYETVRCA